jgi:CubicO group peptidase (beta-lactamase class C family)
VPTLAEFYRGGLRLVAEPGSRHVYSNHGFATLGQIVEDVTARPLADHLRDHVFAPLGMAHTDLNGSSRGTAALATGYTLRAGGPRPVADRELVTIGAGAVQSTTRDMARYVAALLGGGGGLLRTETLAGMYAPHYRPDPRLPGMGLAFFRQDAGGHLVVEHNGLLPGFWSELSVAPGDGVGVVAFTNGTRGGMAWLGREVSGLVHDLLGVPEPVLRADIPQHPEIWAELCGRYSFRGSVRDVQKWFVAGADVRVRRGRLVLRVRTPVPALSRGLTLHPDDAADPYVFRADLSGFDLGTTRVVFGRSPGTGVTGFHLDVAPMSFDKRRHGGDAE